MAQTVVRIHSWRTAILAIAGVPSLVLAQQGDPAWQPREVLTKETYVAPPSAIARLVTAPRQNQAPLSDTRLCGAAWPSRHRRAATAAPAATKEAPDGGR